MGFASAIRSVFGRPRRRIVDPDAVAPRRGIKGRYDAAQEGVQVTNIWAAADALDADAANSLAVRSKLRNRSRYERGNNGDACGVIRTQSNYVIGTGPKLKMRTGSHGFNQMVEAAWKKWVKASTFNRKLRVMCKAMHGDGEAFLQITNNPGLKDRVKLDVRPIECDQITAPVMVPNDKNYVDGVRFDPYGNPESYDVLKRHPGSTAAGSAGFSDRFSGDFGQPIHRLGNQHETIPARFMCHWYGTDRAGQHRGIPTGTATLNLFGTGRRYREAVVAGAETAADFAAVMEMGTSNEGNDEVAPFTTMPLEKGMLVASPAGATLRQMRAEQPTTTYESFTRTMCREQARPFGQPYSVAAADSSGTSFSGGRLDQQGFYVSIWVERQDCESFVCDPVFENWFVEAVDEYGWSVPDEPAPAHSWGWPAMPQIDDAKTAKARQTNLQTGQTRLGRTYAEDGYDFDDEVVAMATEYGISVDEMRAKLLEANFPKATVEDEPDDDEDDDEPDEPSNTPPAKASAGGNGHANRVQGFSL